MPGNNGRKERKKEKDKKAGGVLIKMEAGEKRRGDRDGRRKRDKGAKDEEWDK